MSMYRVMSMLSPLLLLYIRWLYRYGVMNESPYGLKLFDFLLFFFASTENYANKEDDREKMIQWWVKQNLFYFFVRVCFVHFKNLIFYTIRKTDILYSRKHIKILFTQRITNRMNLYICDVDTERLWLLQVVIGIYVYIRLHTEFSLLKADKCCFDCVFYALYRG